MRYLTSFLAAAVLSAGLAGATMLPANRRKRGFRRCTCCHSGRDFRAKGKPASRRLGFHRAAAALEPQSEAFTVVAAAGAGWQDLADRAGGRKVCGRGQEYKAGHLDRAAATLTRPWTWILESGYDPNSDPKLGELFHRVVDTVYGYELQAFGGRWLPRGRRRCRQQSMKWLI